MPSLEASPLTHPLLTPIPSCLFPGSLELPGRLRPLGGRPRKSIPRLQLRDPSRFTSHPRTQQMLQFLCQHFWWPSQSSDVSEFVAAFVVCTKSCHCPPAGLLRPLPVPSCPWSHIAVDSVTGLPLSNGHTIFSPLWITSQDGPLNSVGQAPIHLCKLLTCSPSMFSGSMVSPLTLVQIVVPSLHLMSGRLFIRCLAPPAVSH